MGSGMIPQQGTRPDGSRLVERAWDVIVLGGGAAGLMCAITAGRRGRRVLVLDHGAVLGRKIAISGGGRCNFTNVHARPENYLSANPDFCKSALARFTPSHFIAMVEAHRIPYHEKKLGQLFCDRSARDVIAMLLEECRRAGVRLSHPVEVQAVEKPERFRLETSAGVLEAQSLVVATGGLSLPRTGATGLGYELARRFGHKVTSLHPGLVGLRWAEEELKRWRGLAGVSVDALVKAGGGPVFRENILFTHTGLSGPAMLQASNYWSPGTGLSINLLPECDARSMVAEAGGQTAYQLLAKLLPKRLACEVAASLPGEPLARVRKDERDALAERVARWSPCFSGTEGYGRAEVTRGGVDTARLSSKTMESRDVPGLFFIGEVVDVTGWLGGYNFQWAWASGHAAGLSA